MIGADENIRFDDPIDADDIVEFHATRLMLLLAACKRSGNSIKGRTKLAKLDFFVRYPGFLEKALKRLDPDSNKSDRFIAGTEGIESGMIRYRYGPWDHRYYNLIALLRSRNLIKVSNADVESYTLTKIGFETVASIERISDFAPLVARCNAVATGLGAMKGTALKDFVYEAFTSEVADLEIGDRIEATDSYARGES